MCPASASIEYGPLELLIFQSSSYCNLNCAYCYLSPEDRKRRRRMAVETVLTTVTKLFDAEVITRPFTIVWHAGEPLTAGLDFYRKCFDGIAAIGKVAHLITHTIQTNGTLITDEWAELFREYDVRIGVSIDGPPEIHDHKRRDWLGQPTHAKVVNGIETLKRHGVPFYTISVLTEVSLARPRELIEYLISLGSLKIGFNIEENEGHNRSSLMDEESCWKERYRDFFRNIYDFCLEQEVPEIVREFSRIHNNIGRLSLPRSTYLATQQNLPYRIISVNADGNFSTFSPELLSQRDSHYGDFILGNVYHDDFRKTLLSPKLQTLAADIRLGVEKCAAECAYFNVCGGGAPSNKLAENGSFASTETAFCRFTKQLTTDIILKALQERLTQQEAP